MTFGIDYIFHIFIWIEVTFDIRYRLYIFHIFIWMEFLLPLFSCLRIPVLRGVGFHILHVFLLFIFVMTRPFGLVIVLVPMCRMVPISTLSFLSNFDHSLCCSSCCFKIGARLHDFTTIQSKLLMLFHSRFRFLTCVI